VPSGLAARCSSARLASVVSLPVQPQRILAEQNKAHSAQDVKTETNKEYGYGTVLLMSCFADDVGANSEICLYLVEI
jgi:hypothetical protein